MLHEKQRCLFDPRGLPLAPLDDHHRGVEVLLLLAESHLHRVLLLYRPQVLVGRVWWSILKRKQDFRVSEKIPYKLQVLQHLFQFQFQTIT